MKPSPDKLEKTVSVARGFLVDRENLDYAKPSGGYGLAYDFAEAIVQLADTCVVGAACDRHGGAVHGQEAEELRAGVEQILRNTSAVGDEDASDVLRGLRKSLVFLLDRIDARDSLAFREATDPSEQDVTART